LFLDDAGLELAELSVKASLGGTIARFLLGEGSNLLLDILVVSLSTAASLLKLSNAGVDRGKTSSGIVELREHLADIALSVTTTNALLIELITEVVVLTLESTLSLLEGLTGRDLAIESLLEVLDDGVVVDLEVLEFTGTVLLLIKSILKILNFSGKVTRELISASTATDGILRSLLDIIKFGLDLLDNLLGIDAGLMLKIELLSEGVNLLLELPGEALLLVLLNDESLKALTKETELLQSFLALLVSLTLTTLTSVGT
jgi:hypothetical protein